MIYISSSWKNRERVRAVAKALRGAGYEVYDFTDVTCRKAEEIPPEKFQEEFDPEKHVYHEYLNKSEWKNAVMENREALDNSVVVVLLLPCGLDSHADWAYAVGKGARSVIVGNPGKGERVPTHLWADVLIETDEEVTAALVAMAKLGYFSSRVRID